jgi:hypothetical protein
MKTAQSMTFLTQPKVKTELPRYVRRKFAKGRAYYYFDTGRKDARGKPVLLPLPEPGTAGFATQLKKAELARWQHHTRLIPPLKLGRRPADDFDPTVLEAATIPETGDDLYFIRAGNAVKIGRAANVFERMVNMQANNHLELDCICRLPRRGFEERHWQSFFRDSWIRGEWFEWTPELADAIGLARRGQRWWSINETRGI